MLSCKELLETVKTSFGSVKEEKKRQRPISLFDTLMSGYALFSLKYRNCSYPYAAARQMGMR